MTLMLAGINSSCSFFVFAHAMQFMATAITVFIRIGYIVNDGFPRQIFGQWFALGLSAGIADGFLFSFWVILFNVSVPFH